jgi:hypothetical protein
MSFEEEEEEEKEDSAATEEGVEVMVRWMKVRRL